MRQAEAETLVYQTVWDTAMTAANAAGDKWVAEHTQPVWGVMDGNRLVGTMLDVCGIVYIRCRDRRNKFWKWCIKTNRAYSHSLALHHKYRMRQEQGLNEACAYAALQVFSKAGIDCFSVYSRID